MSAPIQNHIVEPLPPLVQQWSAEFGVGYGVNNLESFRRFYLEYPHLLTEQISSAPSRKSSASKNSDTVRRNLLDIIVNPPSREMRFLKMPDAINKSRLQSDKKNTTAKRSGKKKK